MDTEEYLQHLYRLETSCYEQNQLINHLNEQLNRLKSAPDKKHIRGNYKDESGLGLSDFALPILIVFILYIFGLEVVGYIAGGIVFIAEWLLCNPKEEKKYNQQEKARVV